MYYSEKCAKGKFDVFYSGLHKNYPRRIGFIVGSKTTWEAERGPINLGYFKSKNLPLKQSNKNMNVKSIQKR